MSTSRLLPNGNVAQPADGLGPLAGAIDDDFAIDPASVAELVLPVRAVRRAVGDVNGGHAGTFEVARRRASRA